MENLTVFFVSDHTGVTAEAVGKSLLSQFRGLTYKTLTIPFIDTPEKASDIAKRVQNAAPALIISTLTDPDMRAILQNGKAPVFDVFEAFSGPLAAFLGVSPAAMAGQTHGMSNTYDTRMDAVNFALSVDDGLNPEKLGEADLILVGVSRAGKTPVSLYLALQYGKKAANYPLTPDDLDASTLPEVLLEHKAKLRGLTLAPERLAQIRNERLPGSRYASLENCRKEIQAVEALLKANGVLLIDSSRRSVEEIAALIVHGS
ncbi:MAG: kinase/pyrophosphorylase [Hydrogenophilaceae bacterium]|nr:kinase/pyrophosphorylase [Hydrogenophilaceae bacterium]